jgi:uncharacterized protein
MNARRCWGPAFNLGNGIIRASSRQSLEQRIAVDPSKIYEYTIDLWPTSNLFAIGHQIRIEISSSNFPHYDRNLNTGAKLGTATEMIRAAQTILHNGQYPSRVVLPIVP